MIKNNNMNLSKILTISGKSGLFKVLAQSKNAVIVESIIDKKRFPVYTSTKVVALDEISVFTTDEDKPLKEILLKIFEKENAKSTPDLKSDAKALLKYFEEVLPEFDKERVYVSDIKKIISWYNLLVAQNLIDLEEEKKEETTEMPADIQSQEGSTQEENKETVTEVVAKPKVKKEKKSIGETEELKPKAKTKKKTEDKK